MSEIITIYPHMTSANLRTEPSPKSRSIIVTFFEVGRDKLS